MVWIRRYKQKKLISKISVDSNFTFSSYAWSCVFHCSQRLPCWKKSLCTRLSGKIALISYWNDFSLIPFRKCASQRRTTKKCKKFKFSKFWERLLFDIREDAFKPYYATTIYCFYKVVPFPFTFLVIPINNHTCFH